jgi:hypothetical protein
MQEGAQSRDDVEGGPEGGEDAAVWDSEPEEEEEEEEEKELKEEEEEELEEEEEQEEVAAPPGTLAAGSKEQQGMWQVGHHHRCDVATWRSLWLTWEVHSLSMHLPLML